VFESYDPVDEHDGNVPSVAACEVWGEVNVDFPERVLSFAAGGVHGLFGFVAEVTTRSRVERDKRLSRVVCGFSLIHFDTYLSLRGANLKSKIHLATMP